MKHLTYLVALATLLVACKQTQAVQTASGPAVEKQDLQTWMNIMAGDAMRGRASGSPEIKLAAGFLAGQMQSFGLTPVPGSDSYFHAFTFGRGDNKFTEYNVVGYLEGSDPELKNEYILIGGHYDHVGIGQVVDGDSIYNGADDDASGTLTMLGLAKMLSMGERPARSIVFAAWAAEEMGLQGSKAFAANPPIALENMMVNLNLEMLGHAEDLGEGRVYMTGPQYSNLDDLLAPALKEGGFELIADPFPDWSLFYRSDNASFISLVKDAEPSQGIPAHTLCTWGGESHYHKPDDSPEIVNYDNMYKLLLALAPAVQDLANMAETVNWTDEGFVRYTGE